jgi:hypothetical protein
MSQSPISQAINRLKPKEKEPRSARVLDGWIAQAQQSLGGADQWRPARVAHRFHGGGRSSATCSR